VHHRTIQINVKLRCQKVKPQISVELRLFIFATNDEKLLVCHRGIRHKTGICRRENAGMIHC